MKIKNFREFQVNELAYEDPKGKSISPTRRGGVFQYTPTYNYNGKKRIRYIVKEENGKWYDADGNVICEEINGVCTPLPQYENDEIDYTTIL